VAMRLDIFLKLSRLCPRRSAAQQLCDAGFVFLNGQRAKSAHPVKSEDQIAIRTAGSETVARVLKVPTAHNVSHQSARELVEIISRGKIASLSPDVR
jgi:ribosomal 50S subunit-recycling heat shock protein